MQTQVVFADFTGYSAPTVSKKLGVLGLFDAGMMKRAHEHPGRL